MLITLIWNGTALDSDPYAVLGIARGATDVQIAQARHQLVRKYHPDVNHDPGAAARFDAVQQAFDLLSDPAARAEYDRTHDEQGGALVMRAADGGYGLGGEAAVRVFIEPASVDFGVLTPQRPWADAAVTVAWTGAWWPGDISRNVGNGWWRVRDSTHPASSCIVFRLRAAAHCGGPKGQQHDQFTVTVNGTVLTADLSAEFQGDFSAVTKPNFDLPTPRRAMRREDFSRITIAAALAVYLFLAVMAVTHGAVIPTVLAGVAWILALGMAVRRDVLRARDAGARDEDRAA